MSIHYGGYGVLTRASGLEFGTSFTAAGWVLQYSGAATSAPWYVFHKRGPALDQFQYGLYLAADFKLTWQVSANGTSYTALAAAAPITLDAHHEFIAYYDAGRAVIGLAVDGGAPVETAQAGLFSAVTDFVVGGGLSTGAAKLWGGVDELGTWDKAFTAEDRAQHWNGGAGSAWPFAIQPVIRRYGGIRHAVR